MLMSALVSRTVFERVPHLEDEIAYLFQAKVFERGQLTVPIYEPRRSYWQPFVVEFEPTGQRFSKYTPGWSLILAAGVNMGQAWVVNAFLAALTVALTYRLGKEIFNADTGLMAAALTAFSPMLLLLNGSLMGHTAALCCTMLFMYAYWRLTHGRRGLLWGALAGLALGLLIINRPITAVSVALPFVMWSGLSLLKTARWSLGFMVKQLRPLLLLTAVALLISTVIPIYNTAAAGNPRQNLYLLVWDYDQLGFGECCGRNGHRLDKGIRQTRWDLSMAAADIFGWQLGSLPEDSPDWLRSLATQWNVPGVSWALLPFALFLGFKQRWPWLALWFVFGFFLLAQTSELPNLLRQEGFASIWRVLGLPADPLASAGFGAAWMIAALVWICAPFGVIALLREDHKMLWTWLLASVSMCLILAHVAYWVGAQLYSTRYYAEGVAALAILSAVPLAWLAHRWKALPVYTGLAMILFYSLYAYSTPRITPLYRLNLVNPDVVEQVKARAQGDRPILVLASGDRVSDAVKWRSLGSLMAVTSPFLDSPIVIAWDFAPNNHELNIRQKILDRFPNRQIIEIGVQDNAWWFLEK